MDFIILLLYVLFLHAVDTIHQYKTLAHVHMAGKLGFLFGGIDQRKHLLSKIQKH